MPNSRRRAWLRDELILAQEVYIREGATASAQSVNGLSSVLRAFPIESELASDPTFRSPAAVRRKLANFLALDPEGERGLSHGGRGDRGVWKDFANDPGRLGKVATAIREALAGLAESERLDQPAFSEAPEGRLLTQAHVARERSAKLVQAKKKNALAEAGRLACEVCSFDFADAYGDRGEGFIECHHLLPLATLRPGHVTHLRDLALLCSNCHRMVHRSTPWLTLEQLKTSFLHEAAGFHRPRSARSTPAEGRTPPNR
jgi:5-methylcytosine-specific restriction protein A